MVTLQIGLLCHRGVGGSARVAVDLGNALAARSHSVHLFARTHPLGGFADFAPGLAFHPLREGDGHALATGELDDAWSPGDLSALVERVVAVARSSGLDVLHFHYAVPFASVAGEIRRRLGPKVVSLVGTLHGTDVSEHGRTDPGLGPVLAETDALTTVSRSHAVLAKRTFRLSKAPELIPNFVDTDRFRPAPRNRRNGRPARIIHVSNFRAVKDPESVARVFARVRRRLDAELWLVGDGEGVPAVRAILRRAGLEEDVRFFGLHRAVEGLLRRTDILLLTSRTESFSLAALEAAASGVPVVGPRVGGLPEVVTDGETGLLFDPGDEASAAAAVLRILGDADALELMRRRAVRRARRFSSEAMVPRYERLYRRLLDGGNGSGLPRGRPAQAPA